jgi:hypothetical protein
MGASSTTGITGYNYTAAMMAGIANGPIAGVGSIWRNKDRVTLDDLNAKIALGTIPQNPWGYLETIHADQALDYAGLAYIASPNIFLGRSSAELPNLSFEVMGRGMSKVVLVPAGAPVWETAPLTAFASGPGGVGPWTLWSNNSGVGVVGLSLRIYFTSSVSPIVATINKYYGSARDVTIESGDIIDISGDGPIFDVFLSDSLSVISAEVSVSSSPEISFLSSEIPGHLDVDPAGIVEDFLTNLIDGAGFPPTKLADLSLYSDYCLSSGLLLSVNISEQRPAIEYLKAILAATNSEAVPSQGVLKIVPYGDEPLAGNGRTFTPDVTPLYYFDDNHFISTGEDPVVGTRLTSADAFNHVQVEYLNRAKDYNVDICEAKDQADIEDKGLRTMDVVQMHFITEPAVAQIATQIALQRALYIRNTYKFRLSWNYALLEPMDIVGLTDPGLGLDRTPVRIKLIEETDDDCLEFTVEEIPPGVSTAQSVTPPPSEGYMSGNQKDPGASTAPIIFEPPEELCAAPARPEIWLAASGGAEWGGCEVWLSANGETFASIGLITGKPILGSLHAALVSHTDPDTTNTLSVDLVAGSPTVLGGTQTDVDTFQTLCYVGGELVAFRDAALTATDQYGLTYLRRGAYATTITSHAIGAPFLRLDNRILRFAYPSALIGLTVHIKTTSFNLYGKAKQSLAEVPAYDYTLTGF